MPRTARQKSPSNVYHVMLRGINRQQIFEDLEDYQKFLSILSACKAISQFKLYAYCLMGNHVHLLIEPAHEPLGTLMKRIGCRFACWYNVKYQRTGHLFQDRYKSQIIEDEAHFIHAFCYIHLNPVKGHLSESVTEYPWSSCHDYQIKHPYLIDPQKVYDVIGDADFIISIFARITSDYAPKPAFKFRLTDSDAGKIIYKLTSCHNVSEFQVLDKSHRNTYIKILKASGLSFRQIERLCGVSKSTAERISHL